MATKKVVEPGTEKIVKTVRRTNKATGEGTFTEFGVMNPDGTQFQRQTRIQGDLSDIPTQESTRLTDVADAVTGRKERVRTQADIPFLENQQIGQQFGIPTEGLPGNLQESLDMQREEFARQKAFQEGQLDFQEQQQLAQQARLRQQQMSAVEGVEASLSQGREGIFSTSMAQAKDVFTTALRQDMKQAADAFNFAQTQRAEAKRQLQLAEQGNNQKLIQQAKVALQQAENELVQQETNLRNSQAKAAEAAISIREQFFTELEAIGAGAVANLPADMLQAAFAQAGINPIVATAYQQEALRLAEASKSEDLFEQQKAQFELAKLQQDLKFAGMTPQQKNFLFLQDIEDPIEKAKFERMITSTPNMRTVKVGDDLYSFNPVTGATEKVVDQSRNNDLAVTGELVTQNINGKTYTLDSAAMVAFQQANEAALQAGVGEIKTQSTHTASFRSPEQQKALYGQGRTIEDLLASGVFSEEEAIKFAQPSKPRVTNTANRSAHMSGLALDIHADIEYINKVKPFLEAQGYKQTALSIGDYGHFEFQGRTGTTRAKEIAANIFKGVSTATIKDLPTDERADVERELNFLREQAAARGDMIGVIRASAGGDKLTGTQEDKFQKLLTTINQVETLNELLSQKGKRKGFEQKQGIDLSPITGFIAEKNPWAQDAQTIKAALQGTVPNLARGVFGEVGVLTDRDINLYKQTLPNLRQPAKVRKSVTAITMRTLRNSLDDQIEFLASSGNDVSGLEKIYQRVDSQVKNLEKDLGIFDVSPDSEDSVLNKYGYTTPSNIDLIDE